MGEVEEIRGNLSAALDYYKQAEEYRRKDGDRVSLGQSLSAIGAMAARMGDFETALSVLDEAYTMAMSIENKEGMAVALKNIGLVQTRMKNYVKALESYQRSIDISGKTGNRDLRRETYGLLSDMYTENGNFERSLKYYKLQSALKDSIFNENASKNTERLRVAYESERKENENENLRIQKEDQDALLKRNSVIILLVSVLLCLILFIAMILYWMNRVKKKTNKILQESNKAISQQRDEIEQQNKELEEALEKIGVLNGLIPICASCKKIRDDSGYWNEVEKYISEHSQASFSHGICPDCFVKLYPELRDLKEDGQQGQAS